MLKVPIDIELDVLGIPPTNSHQIEGQELLKLIEDSRSAIVISGVNQAELCSSNVEISSNQLVGQLEQVQVVSTAHIQDKQDTPGHHQEGIIAECQLIDSLAQIQDEQDNSGNYQEDTIIEFYHINSLLVEQGFATIQPLPPVFKKKLTKRVFDSLNDGLTLAVNTVGTILFLGKLANYSWE
ncbi:hypothetical protein [Mastigocladopsis repens]|uniref:hypothetical protein n=1 Tax=Mastigocladopsis repens TaxID=221287 RepID=UPI00030E960F|nr:hypothetical protein [Mastigocladopsis repens]